LVRVGLKNAWVRGKILSMQSFAYCASASRSPALISIANSARSPPTLKMPAMRDAVT
jgi:hypothetical protein